MSAGLTIFLTWALCRELDPDHDLSAFVAAGLGMVGVTLWGLPHLLALFWALLAVRVVNRTTGLHATVLDAVTLVGLGAWLAIQQHWSYAVITVIAFLLDAQLAPALGRQLVFAGVSALIAVGAGLWGRGADFDLFWRPAGIALGLSTLFIPVVIGSQRIKSLGDETGRPLHPPRVQAGQGIALLAGLSVALFRGGAGLVALMPLWAAAIGAALYGAWSTLKGGDSVKGRAE